MEINLLCTPHGLTPLYDADHDDKKRLAVGKVYKARIVTPRNLSFHNKYFTLISLAWSYMSENQRAFFKDNRDGFRKTIEIESGYYQSIYSVERKEWVKAPMSISFISMDKAAFEEVYNRVFDTLMKTVFKGMSREEFERVLSRF